MATRVLVAYGSKYGATAEIAEKIGETLRQAGLDVDVTPVKSAGPVSDYQATVIGSAVYIGQWRKEVGNFLRNNEELLCERPVWLFCSGPPNKGDPVELLKGWRYPQGLAPLIERLKPRDIAVFHGRVDLAKMNFFYKWMVNRTKTPAGDFRDWNAIAGWAAKRAAALKKRQPR
jgi:menaquinone-dependent protoporphyrinogen oxidase